MNRVKFIEIKTAERSINQNDEVFGRPGKVVDVIAVCAVCNTGKPINDGNKHESERNKMTGTMEEGGPQNGHVAYK